MCLVNTSVCEPRWYGMGLVKNLDAWVTAGIHTFFVLTDIGCVYLEKC